MNIDKNKKDFKKAQGEYEYKLDNPFNDGDDDQLFGEPDYYKQYIEDIG